MALFGGIGNMAKLAQLASNPEQLLPMAADVMPGHARMLAVMSLTLDLSCHATAIAALARHTMTKALSEKRDISDAERQQFDPILSLFFERASVLYELPEGKLNPDDFKRALGIVGKAGAP